MEPVAHLDNFIGILRSSVLCHACAGDPAAQIEEVLCPEDMLAELASELPIGEVLPALVDSLEQAPNLVLRAPPGTGKTTVVPLAPLLHGSPWLGPKQRILVRPPSCMTCSLHPC